MAVEDHPGQGDHQGQEGDDESTHNAERLMQAQRGGVIPACFRSTVVPDSGRGE
jgi:hypothetical protein